MYRTAMMMMALIVSTTLTAPAVADAASGESSSALVKLRVDGGSAALRGHVRQAMQTRVAGDPSLTLTSAAPSVTGAGAARGYVLDLQLDYTVERSLSGYAVQCSILQSIWDLEGKALRGSANQRAALQVGKGTSQEELEGYALRCIDALVPAAHEGMADFVVESVR